MTGCCCGTCRHWEPPPQGHTHGICRERSFVKALKGERIVYRFVWHPAAEQLCEEWAPREERG